MRRSTRLVPLLLALTFACSKAKDAEPASGGGRPRDVVAPAGPSVTLVVAYGSEKKTWMEEATKAFLASSPRTPSGRAIAIDGRPLGSGEATQSILDGTLKPHVFSPASGAYITLLNQRWLTSPGQPHTRPLAPAGEPLVLSPIVLAMWRPMAEVLGWPDKPIGWADVIRVSRDPRGWGALGHPEWGSFKLGHTHPDYSNSGLLAVLAEAYGGAGKTRDLSRADLATKGTRDFVSAVEGAIVHYGKSTGYFFDQMVAHGESYLSCAVLYENLVIESYGKPSQASAPLVAVYPVEGTFWSDHPYAVLDAPWVGDEEQAAAAAFLAFLKARPQQERALALGFRPADPAIAVGAPIDAAHGVDARQPETLLEVPDGAVLEELLALWRALKKPTDVVLVFDKSGSMGGEPLAQAKKGAQAFLAGLHDRDEVSVLFFDDKLYPATPAAPLATARADLQRRIDGVIADGGTALFDAIGAAYQAMQRRAREQPARIHAIVVMTDGKDESSSAMRLESLERQFSGERAAIKIFTIAYGESADPTALKRIADAAQGQSVKGSAETIVQVYRDLSAFF